MKTKNWHTTKHQMTKTAANKLFKYVDGELFWKKKAPYRMLNRAVGCVRSTTGYRYSTIKNENFAIHTLIWNLHYGKISKGFCIDHIDRDKTNNRIENLRLMTHRQNMRNKAPRRSTGCKGVSRQGEGYTARLTVNRKYVLCKYFFSFFDAVCARKSAELEYGI